MTFLISFHFSIFELIISFIYFFHSTCKSDSGLRSINSNFRPPRGSDKIRAASGPSVFPRSEDMIRNEPEQPDDSYELRTDPPLAPHPLPMPEYGGYFAPLTEYLPDISLPISGFHR